MKPLYSMKLIFLALNIIAILLVFIVTRISLKDIKYNLSLELSKLIYHQTSSIDSAHTEPDIVIRSVYLDNRSRNGYKHSAVFLVEIRKSILKEGGIVRCEIGSMFTNNIQLHRLNINGIVGEFVEERPYQSHTMIMVDCFELSGKNGSNATLIYKKHDNDYVLRHAVSERPLLVPTLKNSSKSLYTIATCLGVGYGDPPFLGEWLKYQESLGVDHVFLNVDETFTSHLKQPHVRSALEKGFISINTWNQRLKSGSQIDYHSQLLSYHDCLYRALDTYDYMLFNDQDDFFIPRNPFYKTLHYYIDNWCHLGSCSFKWIEYYPDCGMKHAITNNDGNLTMLLLSNVHKEIHPKKCLHKVGAVVEIGIHEAREMIVGYKSVTVPVNIAYVAHLRKWRKPTKC